MKALKTRELSLVSTYIIITRSKTTIVSDITIPIIIYVALFIDLLPLPLSNVVAPPEMKR